MLDSRTRGGGGWPVPFPAFSTIIIAVALAACLDKGAPRPLPYEDGTYRGIFADKDAIQVNVQFTLKDGIVTNASFRFLKGPDEYFLDTEEEPYRSVINQYKESLEYLVGKNLMESLNDLYYPAQIVQTEVDGYTSATVRSTKILSAIRDALNRGVYHY